MDSQGKEPGATCLRPGLHLTLMCRYNALDFCLDPVPSPASLKGEPRKLERQKPSETKMGGWQ